MTMPTITITDQFSPTRWREYRDLRIEAVTNDPHAFVDTPEEDRTKPDIIWQERLAAAYEGQKSRGFFALHDDRLIGITFLLFEPQLKLRHQAGIRSVYLQPAYRGHGLGRKLVGAAIDYAREQPHLEVLRLDVDSENTAAYELYKALGFVTIGKEHKVLKSLGLDRDQFVMELLL